MITAHEAKQLQQDHLTKHQETIRIKVDACLSIIDRLIRDRIAHGFVCYDDALLQLTALDTTTAAKINKAIVAELTALEYLVTTPTNIRSTFPTAASLPSTTVRWSHND